MNLSEFSRNPEMLIHLEGPFALYREINHILKRLGYNNFKYIDILKPSKFTLISIELPCCCFTQFSVSSIKHDEGSIAGLSKLPGIL